MFKFFLMYLCTRPDYRHRVVSADFFKKRDQFSLYQDCVIELSVKKEILNEEKNK